MYTSDGQESRKPIMISETNRERKYLAQAIRKNNNPFASLGVFGVVRWTDHCSPHCHQVYRRSYFPAAVSLGESRRTCSACGEVFDDDSKEWPELRSGQKLRYLIPPPILGFFGGVLLTGVLAVYIASQDQSSWVGGALVLFFSLVVSSIPALVWGRDPLTCNPPFDRTLQHCSQKNGSPV